MRFSHRNQWGVEMSGGQHVEFCSKTFGGPTGSVSLVGGRRRQVHKFAMASTGSGRFSIFKKHRDTL